MSGDLLANNRRMALDLCASAVAGATRDGPRVTPDGPLSQLRVLPRPRLEGDGGGLPLTKVNSHVHLPPNFSAFQSVTEATELAAAQGVRVLGASNYYDYSVYRPFAERCSAQGLFPLFGIEVVCLDDDLLRAGSRVNDPTNPGKMYLCGKGITRFDPMDGTAARLMEVVRRSDSERMADMVDQLDKVFSERGVRVSLDEGSVKALVAGRYRVPAASVYLQERHVALAFQEALFGAVAPAERARALGVVLEEDVREGISPVEAQDAIRAHLMKRDKPAYVPEDFVGFDHAYRLVLALGGIPCYPVLADGVKPVSEFEQDVDLLVRSLEERRIYCTELIPNRNDPEVLSRYVTALRGAGFPVLAGTEHNTQEMGPLEPRSAGGTPLPAELRDIFWEGACVVAAHEYLVANGEAGYVDAEGALAPSHVDRHARVEAFARLGAAVIEEYFKMTAPSGERRPSGPMT